MSEEDINNLKEMLVDFNEYSTDYTKTRCRELEETIENTLKEIERLNNKIKSIVYQCYKSDMSYGEFKRIWVNAMGKIYEPSQIDELEKELGVDKE